ncbi:hypothetical protein [Metabacillus sp. FJAT-53654]|uniref:Uncharacterized protein n=1 Tax=Metabacillus rhizosphaerae TaxID=3117747 RepID=A0ABZ2MYJ7_9BACI
MKEVCEGFWNCISPDAWFTGIGTLIGAFLGAFLAGLFTIFSVRKQLKHDSSNKKKQEITSYLKISSDFSSRIKAVINAGEELEKRISHDDTRVGVFEEKTIKHSKGYLGSLNNVSKEISTMNYHQIPYEFYNCFIIGKEIIDILKVDVEFLIDDLQKPIRTDYIHWSDNYEGFTKGLKKLKEISNSIDEFDIESKQELQKINKVIN